jgi:pSer/pThr/pTyr-binding forkhead associated (FHA) protein
VAAGAQPQAAADTWLIVERGGGLRQGERFDLIGGLSIGRSGEADLSIDDRYASGVHARIFSRDGHVYIEDMNSTNGTRVNDAELRGEVELIDGDLVQIGDTQFRFEAGR